MQKRAKMDERKLTDAEKEEIVSLEKDVSKKDLLTDTVKKMNNLLCNFDKNAKHAEEIHEMSMGKIIVIRFTI